MFYLFRMIPVLVMSFLMALGLHTLMELIH